MHEPLGRRRVLTIAVALAVVVILLYVVPRESHLHIDALAAAELLLFGFVVGAYGTMVGAGGGFLIVPALLLVYHVTPQQAAGTSLLVVFLNAVSGTISYGRQGRVDYRSGLLFAFATLPGAVIGAFLTNQFSGRAFDVLFGIVLLLIAGLLVWRPVAEEEYADALIEEGEQPPWWRIERRLTDRSGEKFSYEYNVWIGIGVSFVVGFLSSLLGIGGGIIHVPALIHLLGFPAHIAAATSHFILAISAGAGAGTHLFLHNTWLGISLLMGAGVVVGAPVGAGLARRLKGSITIRLLSLALLLVALRLLLR